MFWKGVDLKVEGPRAWRGVLAVLGLSQGQSGSSGSSATNCNNSSNAGGCSFQGNRGVSGGASMPLMIGMAFLTGLWLRLRPKAERCK